MKNRILMKKRLPTSHILRLFFLIFLLIGNITFNAAAQQKRLTEKEKQEKIDSLINNSDVIVEGACYEYVTPIVIDNKLYSVTLLNISHIYKGENLPSKVFFIREEYNFCLSNENTTIIRKYKEGTSIKHHYISYGGGIFFLKKCFSPIELFDATNSDAEISLIFQTNKSIKFSPNEKYVFQPTDEYEWGIDHGINTIGSEYYGPYQKKFSCKKELLEFLHKYENIKMPDYLDESYFQNNTTITDSIKKNHH